MGKHTKGPWFLQWQEPPLVQHAGWKVKQDDEHQVHFPIAMVTQTVGGRRSPQRANAQLIAAAPDLLEVLQKVLNRLFEDDGSVAVDGNPIKMIEKVIAKATGE